MSNSLHSFRLTRITSYVQLNIILWLNLMCVHMGNVRPAGSIQTLNTMNMSFNVGMFVSAMSGEMMLLLVIPLSAVDMNMATMIGWDRQLCDSGCRWSYTIVVTVTCLNITETIGTSTLLIWAMLTIGARIFLVTHLCERHFPIAYYTCI